MVESDSENLVAHNYCVSFIDLLGQRDAARGQGLLPIIISEEEDKAFRQILRKNIGGILQIQRDVEAMVKALSPNPNSPLRASLTDEEKVVWDEIQQKSVNTQYWSDGFVRFICLGNPKIKCPLKGVFEIFCVAGYFCLLGLARHRPIRGAIDIAWGTEIRPGELYGPAVIRAYELESEVAQYPRIIVGQEVIKFLEAHKANSEDEPFTRVSREYAQSCLDMLVQDVDGHWIVHYLGDAFKWAVTHEQHGNLCEKARRFVVQQLEAHKQQLNGKLAFRYSHLLAYFDVHLPSA